MRLVRALLARLRPEPEPPAPSPRFPGRNEADAWMAATLEHWIRWKPESAHLLFDPSSGDYLPLAVHVGSTWNTARENAYRALKARHPDLVARARESYREGGRYHRSSVGDMEDFDPDVDIYWRSKT